MDHDKTGKELYTNTVIPNRGAWLEYETDANDLFYVRIDKNRKIFITTFLRALGLGLDHEIIDYFGEDERLVATIEKDTTKNQEESTPGGVQAPASRRAAHFGDGTGSLGRPVL